jgi:TyrR family helix-turn-helix protein
MIDEKKTRFGSYNLKDEMKKLEMEILKKAMKEYETTREMAKVLGINQSNVVRKLKKYNMK